MESFSSAYIKTSEIQNWRAHEWNGSWKIKKIETLRKIPKKFGAGEKPHTH